MQMAYDVPLVGLPKSVFGVVPDCTHFHVRRSLEANSRCLKVRLALVGCGVRHPLAGATVHSSSRQVDEQPSRLTVLASSHCSPLVRIPSPHTSVQTDGRPVQRQPGSIAHTPEQPSPSTRSPSSQASPLVTIPLPHAVGVQFESHPSPSTALPSSQVSPHVPCTVPSPQVCGLPTPRPVAHASRIVPTAPSSQPVPSAAVAFVQMPLVVLQTPATWH